MPGQHCIQICQIIPNPLPQKPIRKCFRICLPPILFENPFWPQPGPDGFIQVDDVKPEVLNSMKAISIIADLVQYAPKETHTALDHAVSASIEAIKKALPENIQFELVEHR